MVVFSKGGANNSHRLGRSVSLRTNRVLLEELISQEPQGSINTARHVIFVMDALKEFESEPFDWALEHVIKAGTVVILLGVKPWLTIPLSIKTMDVWPSGQEGLSIVKDKVEWKNDAKYLKLQTVVESCSNYGVVLKKKAVMGHPTRQLVVDEIANLHATWVVLDRHHQKADWKFYAEKLSCNIVMMNDEGDAELLKGKTMIYSMVEPTISCKLSAPLFKIADQVKGMLKKSKSGRKDRSRSRSQSQSQGDI